MNRSMKEMRQLLLPTYREICQYVEEGHFKSRHTRTQAQIGTCLVCLRNRKVVSVVRTEWVSVGVVEKNHRDNGGTYHRTLFAIKTTLTCSQMI